MARPPRWTDPRPRRARLAAVGRDPVRGPLLTGAGVLFVAAFLPWIDAHLPYVPHFEVSGFDHAGDGAIMLFAALGMIAWALAERPVASRVPAVALAPLVTGVACLILTRVAFQNSDILIASFEKRGGGGTILPGLWLAGAAAAVVATAGLGHLVRIRRELRIVIGASRSDVAAVIGGGGGAFAGIVAAIVGVPAIVVSERSAVVGSVTVLAVLTLGFSGAWLGAAAARRLATRRADGTSGRARPARGGR